jgi:hypothetical protein
MNNQAYKFVLILHHETSCYPRKPDTAFEAEANACTGIVSIRKYIS